MPPVKTKPQKAPQAFEYPGQLAQATARLRRRKTSPTKKNWLSRFRTLVSRIRRDRLFNKGTLALRWGCDSNAADLGDLRARKPLIGRLI